MRLMRFTVKQKDIRVAVAAVSLVLGYPCCSRGHPRGGDHRTGQSLRIANGAEEPRYRKKTAAELTGEVIGEAGGLHGLYDVSM